MKFTDVFPETPGGAFLLLFGEGGTAFDVYVVQKSLTPLGWALVVFVTLVSAFATVRFFRRYLKKPKLK